MLNGNLISRRFRRLACFALIAGLAGVPLRAQSDAASPQSSYAAPPPSNSVPAQPGSSAQPEAAQPITAPTATPQAPLGTAIDPATGAVEPPDTRVPPVTDSGYRIGADDVLTINVWHEPEVSRNVPVRPDGKISLPLVGDVQAAGLTPSELQAELEKRFSKFLTDPAVSVIVSDIRSQRINVLGQVFRPGTYPLVPPMSVIDAIANAGGLKEFAKPNKIYILRTLPNGQRQHIKIKYKDVLKGKRGSHDILLQTRDTVVVP